MKLIDYIEKHYNGNKRQFALDNGMKPQQLSPMIKNKKHHVIEGHLCIFKTKLKVSEKT